MDQATILNMSLGHNSMDAIISLDDLSHPANVLKTFWTPAMLDTFGEHRWPFADVQLSLALVAADVVGWDYVYGYPNNVARVWNVYNESTYKTKQQQEFRKTYLVAEDRNILVTNLSEALADVTYIVENCERWDPKFCMAFSLKLAALASPSLVGDDDHTLRLNGMFTAAINEAKRVAYNETREFPSQERTDSGINSRG